MSTKPKANNNPLPLSDILKDLAIIRSTGITPSADIVNNAETGTDSDVQKAVAVSYDFLQAARGAIRLHDSGKVENEGNKIEQVRSKYETLLEDLQ